MAKAPHMDNAAPRTRRFSGGLLSAVILGCTTLLFALCALIGGTESDAMVQPLWQPLLRVHDRVLLALGADELGGVYITKDRLLAHLAEPAEEAPVAAAASVNAFAAKQSVSVYMLAVPTSAGIYGDTLPDNAPLVNEHLILRRFADALEDQVIWIEAASWLSAEKEQYIYYRTDSCWTAYGAFCVYRSAIRKLGFTAVGYDRFSVTHFGSDYFGRLAQQSHYYETLPDMIDLYQIHDAASAEQQVTALRPDGAVTLPSYYRTDLEEAALHPELVFAPESEPVLRIVTENPSSRDLLLLTDHFGSSMIPFLLQHYRSVTAVNLPQTGTLDWRTLTQGDYSQILILCGADTVAAPDGIAALFSEEVQ